MMAARGPRVRNPVHGFIPAALSASAKSQALFLTQVGTAAGKDENSGPRTFLSLEAQCTEPVANKDVSQASEKPRRGSGQWKSSWRRSVRLARCRESSMLSHNGQRRRFDWS